VKITVWYGCRVLVEREFEGEGPDIDLDPANLPNSIVVRRNNVSTIVDLPTFDD